MANKVYKKLIFKIGLTLGILLFVIIRFSVNLSSLLREIVDYKYILFALIIPIFILPVISANRWKLFLKQVSINESISSLIKINMISIFQGLILPSSQGQDFMRIFYIEKRHPENRGYAGATIIIERMIGFVVLCIMSLSFSIFFVEFPNRKVILLVLGIITIVLFLIITLFLNKEYCERISKKNFSNKYISKVFSYLNKLYRAIAYFPYRKVLFSSILLICIFQLSTITVVYFIFKACGYNIPLYQHISIYPIISILSMLPITISGLGIREGFFVYFYSHLGISSDSLVIMSLLNFMIIVLTPTLLGFVISLFEISHNIRLL